MVRRLAELGVRIDIYNSDFGYEATADLVAGLTAHRRHLAPSTATFSLDPSQSDARDALVADGASVVILVGQEPFLSGWVVSDGGNVSPGDPLEYEVLGHDTLLWDVLGWPVPSAGLGGQDVAYWRASGPAETVLKDAVQGNAIDRLGLPVELAPDQERGGNVSVQIRFHPLMDRLETPLRQAGIGFTVELVEGQGLLVDAYEVTEHTQPWDPASGVIVGGDWKRNRPTATRVLAGSQGEAEARQFWGPMVADWEPEMAPRVIEAFVDARDIDDEGETETDVETRMEEALAEAEAEHDLDIELDSTEEFTYGTYWSPGDVVPLAVRPDVTLTAQLDEAELTIDGGIRIRPVVGGGGDPMARALGPLIESVRRLGRSYRDQASR